MKKILAVLTILFFFVGTQAILLGALYKIQSWEFPTIGGETINLIAVGLVLEGTALTLLLLKNTWSENTPKERLELDENRLREAERLELDKNEDELLL